jgi:PAS domain-containing protein
MSASSRRARRNFLFPQMLCIAVGLLSLTTLLAHAYGAAGLSARWIMDPASAFLFLLVAAFLLLQLSHRGPISILSHKTHGSFFGRRLLPASIIVPIALGWIRLAAERAGLVSAPTALVLHVLASIAVMAFIVWLSALQLARASSKASHHWQSVSMVEDGYRKLLDLSGQPVFAVNTRGELTYANDAARAILFPSLQENPQEHSLVDWIGDAAWKDHFAPLLLGMQSASKLHNVLLRPFGSPELQADLHVVQLFRSETEFELLVCARKLRTSPEVLSQSFAAAAIPSTHLSGFATSRL